MLAFGVSNALFYRERTGQGQHVDASLVGAMVSLQAMPITRFHFEHPDLLGRQAPLLQRLENGDQAQMPTE